MKNKMRAPFIRNTDSVFTVMFDVLLASIPAVLWSVYVFGARCITIYCISILTALLCDFIFSKIIYSKQFDISAAVTGLLVAFAMPVSVPLWLPSFASAAGIILAKGLFGGIGKNLFNPAATGICISYIFFSKKMIVFTKPFAYFPAMKINISPEMINANRVSTALDEMKDGIASPGTIMEEFYGLTPGSIGEISAIMLLIGLVFLLFRKTIHFNSVFTFTITFMLLSLLICYADCEPTQFMELQLFTGPAMLIPIYFLNDYTTTPTTSSGRIVFALLLGIGMALIRWKGNAHYGEYFIVLILNILTPFIEKLTYPKVYGSVVRRI